MTLHDASFGDHDGQPATRLLATAHLSAMLWFVGRAVAAVTQVYNPEDLDTADYLMVPAAAWEGMPQDRSHMRRG
jgi:hypothetical protein